ncbi:MAG TPA: alanine--glyoxylate aminotransferase family protein, partial [Myxococcales bacterium]|nr:alanine--glyoxylate aminotransferase family protein [Myxococcales bacterium]
MTVRQQAHTPEDISPSTRRLLGPGPSNVHPRVLQAMAKPLLGHLDPEFLEILNGVQRALRQLFS